MASVNKVTILGNLGRDPEVKYSASGSAVCNLAIATTRNWKNKESGEKQEETEWHRVVLFERLAEVAGQYLKKGQPVYIEGRLRTRKWTDKDGVEKYTTEIYGEQMQLLGSKEDVPKSKPASRPPSRPPVKSGTGFDDMDDSIPF
jgi:single-strand DNA-binding protein